MAGPISRENYKEKTKEDTKKAKRSRRKRASKGKGQPRDGHTEEEDRAWLAEAMATMGKKVRDKVESVFGELTDLEFEEMMQRQ